MTDRERLLQILNVPIYPHENVDPLEAVADYLLDNGVTFGAAVPGHENNYDIAEMSYNNGYAKGLEDGKPKWISVEDKIPEKYGKHLCLLKSCAFRGCYYPMLMFHDQYGFRDGCVYYDDVTHWIPLPEPPETE